MSLAAFALPATAVDTRELQERIDTDLFGLPAPVSLGEPMSSLNAACINYDSLKALGGDEAPEAAGEPPAAEQLSGTKKKTGPLSV